MGLRSFFRRLLGTSPEPIVFYPSEFSLSELIDSSLARLGSNHQQVAETLYLCRMTGTRRDVFADPIAHWIRRLVPPKEGMEVYVCVSGGTYTISYIAGMKTESPARGELPQAVRDFIHQFDNERAYPELVDARPPAPYFFTCGLRED